jgi:Tfp pilus assembly protein PilO
MAKKKLNRITEVLIFCGIFALILLLVHFTLGRRLTKMTNDLKTSFGVKQKDLRAAEELIRKYPDPQKAIDEIEKKAAEFKDIEINKRQLPRIIHLLGRSGNEHGLNVVSIRPREDIKTVNENLPTGVTKVYVEIVLNGTYKKLGDYLADFNKLPVAFFIEMIAVEKISEATTAVSPPGKKGAEKIQERYANLSTVLIISTYMLWEM